MAKNKHTINDIQKALLSSTRYIKEDETPLSQDTHTPTSEVKTDAKVNIDPLVMKQIRILANYQGETPSELINKALSHFLRLKSLQLDQAIQKMTGD